MFELSNNKVLASSALEHTSGIGLLLLGSYYIYLRFPIDMRLIVASMALIASAFLLQVACYAQISSENPELPAHPLHSPLMNHYVTPIAVIISHSLMLAGAVAGFIATLCVIGYLSILTSLSAICLSLIAVTSSAIILGNGVGNFIFIESHRKQVDLPVSDTVSTSSSETHSINKAELAFRELAFGSFIESDQQGVDLPALALGDTSSSETHSTEKVNLAFS